MKDDKHVIQFGFEAKWGVSMMMTCAYDKADSKRPCWPHDEDGVPYPQEKGEEDGCVYLDWVENDGLESLGGPTKAVSFKLDYAEWDEGFTFVLGDFIECRELPS
jgi:hypothetical protein